MGLKTKHPYAYRYLRTYNEYLKALSQQVGKDSLCDLLFRHAVEPVMLFSGLFLGLNAGFRFVSGRGSIILGDHKTVVVVTDSIATGRNNLDFAIFKRERK